VIASSISHAEKLLDHVVLTSVPRHVGRLVSHDGGMLEVTGFNRPVGTGARVASSGGGFARAEVAGFRGNRAILVPLDVDAPLENGARVEPDSATNMVQVGEGLIGRIIDAMGTEGALYWRRVRGRWQEYAAMCSIGDASRSGSTSACARSMPC
jgi:flagellum-specific ATP synthase